jgi:rubredoxin
VDVRYFAGRQAGGTIHLPFAAFLTGAPMKTWMCLICGYVYEEARGDPEAGLPPGTRWEDVPLSWRCPDCGSGKEDFEMIEA